MDSNTLLDRGGRLMLRCPKCGEESTVMEYYRRMVVDIERETWCTTCRPLRNKVAVKIVPTHAHNLERKDN